MRVYIQVLKIEKLLFYTKFGNLQRHKAELFETFTYSMRQEGFGEMTS